MAASLVEEVDAVGAYPCLGGVGHDDAVVSDKDGPVADGVHLAPHVVAACRGAPSRGRRSRSGAAGDSTNIALAMEWMQLGSGMPLRSMWGG